MKRKLLATLLVVGCAIGLPSLARVAATEKTTIRLGTLAPAGTTWEKVYRAWNNSLKKETDGAVSFQFFFAGVAGDEKDVIRKMKLGQMDAGGFTVVGLGQIAKPLLALQTPGIIPNYKTLNFVREDLAEDIDGLFTKEGYRLLGWGDAGFARIFSKKPINKPEDLKTTRPWIPRDDPALPELMKLTGANGVPLGIPEVFPALQTGMVDVVPVSAIAAVALQWFRYVTHVTKEDLGAILSATVLREDSFKALSPDHQKALIDTGKKAHDALRAQLEKEDKSAYKALLGKGITEYSMRATPDQAKTWDDIQDKAIKNLTGRVWSADLLNKVKASAKKAK